jgi:hypothetical protein
MCSEQSIEETERVPARLWALFKGLEIFLTASKKPWPPIANDDPTTVSMGGGRRSGCRPFGFDLVLIAAIR